MESPGVVIDSGSYVFVFYAGTLFLIGLIALIVWTHRLLTDPHSRRLQASIWPIRPVDFVLLLFMLISGLLMVSELISRVWEVGGMQRDALAGILSQAVLLGVFLLFRRYVAPEGRSPLSPVRSTLGDDFQRGLFLFLAAMPIVWCVTLVWLGLATVLETYGLKLELSEQTMVRYFLEAESPVVVVVLALLAVVVAPITEELIFRAGIYRFLKRAMPTTLAMFISSLVFSALHFNLLTFPALIALGVLLCVAYEFTGSIRVPMFLHAFFNFNSVLMLLLQGHA